MIQWISDNINGRVVLNTLLHGFLSGLGWFSALFLGIGLFKLVGVL